MIKLILFDCDGTLLSTKDIHFKALNQALKECGLDEISLGEHNTTFNGLPTKRKLEILRDTRGLNPTLFSLINSKKQFFTQKYIDLLIKPEDYKQQRAALQKLKSEYTMGCCSNAIRKSVIGMLLASVGTDVFNIILSNEDCPFPKPNPSIWLKAMSELGYGPNETLIVEDSEVGIESAKRSGAHFMKVNGPQDIIYENIIDKGKLLYLKSL